MNPKSIRKLSTAGKYSKALNLPREFLKKLNWRQNQNLSVKLDEKNSLMKQKKDLEEKLTNLYSSETAWLEPFRNWVNLASEAQKIANLTGETTQPGSTDIPTSQTALHQKRQFILNTGSNFC